MKGELIHTNFETITEYDQDYRISTKVRFVASGTFKCKACLWKSHGGKVRGEPLYKTRKRTDDESEVEMKLQECVDRCNEKIEDVERAKLLEIDVTVK